MSTNDAGALQNCPTDEDDCTDLDDRDVRALTERMGVLPLGEYVYTVVGCNAGGEYRVEVREGRCTCPDHEYRGVRCKHVRRVAFATGRRAIPASVDRDDVDELLGVHLEDEGPRFAVTDGGSASKQTDPDEEVVDLGEQYGTAPGVAPAQSGDEDGDVAPAQTGDDGPDYTYHWEPARVGGARYVRCEECGAECVPADPDRLVHYQGCSKAREVEIATDGGVDVVDVMDAPDGTVAAGDEFHDPARWRTCPRCGVDGPAESTSCWRCGAAWESDR